MTSDTRQDLEMDAPPALVAIVVFLAAAAVDYAAARYTLAMTSRRGGRRTPRLAAAGAWSVAICLLSTVGLLALVDVSRWMVVPECVGLFAGTLLSGRAAAAADD